MGITSLGSLPFLAPLIDLHGRKLFIVAGILGVGLSNIAFLFFEHYSPMMILIRLFQGLAFAACFNGCATAVVDLIPRERRAQGIGLFGISGSLAMAIGPYLGEICIINWGFTSYFLLLLTFGLMGLVTGLLITESAGRAQLGKVQGFFSTALKGGHIPMMMIAAHLWGRILCHVDLLPAVRERDRDQIGHLLCVLRNHPGLRSSSAG